jgi:hypothetical protein
MNWWPLGQPPLKYECSVVTTRAITANTIIKVHALGQPLGQHPSAGATATAHVSQTSSDMPKHSRSPFANACISRFGQHGVAGRVDVEDLAATLTLTYV